MKNDFKGFFSQKKDGEADLDHRTPKISERKTDFHGLKSETRKKREILGKLENLRIGLIKQTKKALN